MKWEKIKQYVAANLRETILNGGSQSYEQILIDLVQSNFEIKRGITSWQLIEKYADKAYDVVMEWDIRCVGKLRELFPYHFPKTLQKGNLQIDQDEIGDWVIYIKRLDTSE